MSILKNQKPKINSSNIEDAKFEEVKETKSSNNSSYSKGSEQIDLDAKTTSKGEKAELNFMDGNFVNDFVKKQTKEAPEDDISDKGDYSGSKNITQDDIKNAEEQSKQRFTANDMANIAKVLVMILDTGISTALRFFAKDTSDHAYSIAKEKKDMLEYQLTLLLVKYQTKFSIEFMFLATLVVVYSVPFTKARDRRKEWKKAQEEVFEEEGENATDIPKSELQQKIYKKRPSLKRQGGQPHK